MFDIKAQERLGYYVYALFDPNNPKWPFYIGKGCGNRVFAHAGGNSLDSIDDEPLSAKFELIARIKHAHQEVLHKIIRFGLSEEEAFKVEAALIDLVNYIRPDTLKNEISGQGVAEGIYDAADLALSLCAPKLQSDLPLLIIKIERQWTALLERFGTDSTIPNIEIYESTKGNWKLNALRASRAECVLSVARGLVRSAFVPSGWADSGEDKRKVMTGFEDTTRYDHFVGTSVAHLFERGSQNPIRYLQC
ncbi:MAG: hypothetical protein JWQ98_3544 [Chlorobi bacterium]|nr:hypothetical protein [Chlorobiota bacterium]